jgi:hypothetical protein
MVDDHPDGKALLTLTTTKMPFGRYEGRSVIDLPEDYLLWFRQKGFPQGALGRLMALALEIKVNGLDALVNQALGRAPRDPRSVR